jgi:hypothetical protein
MNFIALGLIAFTFLNPMGIPIPEGIHAQLLYDFVEAQTPGGIYAVSGSFMSFANYGDVGYGGEALLMRLFENDAKIVVYCPTTTQYPAFNKLVNTLIAEMEPLGKEYGTDLVYFYYLQDDTLNLAIGRDMGFLAKDVYGTSVDDLPLMQEIQSKGGSMDACRALIGLSLSGTPIIPYWQEYVGDGVATMASGYIPVLNIAAGITISSVMPMYPERTICVVPGTVGSAQYMILINDLRWPVQATDVTSMMLTLIVVYSIIGNIAYWKGRLGGKDE